MRVLLATTAGAGHFGPLVPVADAAQRRGDEVLVVAPQSFAGFVERAGYRFRPGADPPEEELRPVWERVPTLSRDEANEVVVREIFGRLDARAMLPGVRAAIEEWRPDLVLRDPSEFASAVAVEIYGIPHARVAIGLAAFEEEALRIAAGAVDELRRSVGLPADPDADAIRRSRYLTTVAASVEDPIHLGPSKALRFRDPGWEVVTTPLPDWWNDGDAPFVYVTFGTVAATLPLAASVYRNALEAVDGLPANVLLTTGDRGDPNGLGLLPANVHVERFVPQREILGHASAVVHHGGFGSTMGALAAGVPAVVVPLFADQPYNARRVEAIGAGLALDVADGPGSLRAALERVLDEPSFRDAACRIAGEMRALPTADEVLAAVL
jgi:UDP:flavonoid glycosyltransferase YjiC (YdhE family)